ncbi:phosphatidylinositol N-acetylglucosaminyltransferase [Malassezia vespertilionis]|uniref:Phosphatidylinositol N-acetylglucosaminyltransferase GPI3 subunit n=1 Tax=Malassezia vespertilionis TaxID=2020962 RepID=A0A2N1J731_9BASI|nr:phosphatidylinositol N-acetylglucosaminyltransferase [Malassezia vespertilionis]PKI82272.1 hypothetical protein MVES_003812 [Malassezia vespertilionis]WFD07914.1 phosphatidylinositol N-acetylglucosaminyltransferase [Malassezia vespertilionis]
MAPQAEGRRAMALEDANDSITPMLATLHASLMLLQTPHPEDGKRVGSTMARGMDEMRAWVRDAKQRFAVASDAKRLVFCSDGVWEIACARLYAAMDVSHTSTVNRARAILEELLHVWECARGNTSPPSFPALCMQTAAAHRGSQASLATMDALVRTSGLAILTPVYGDVPVRALLGEIIEAMQAGLGNISRRSKLAMALLGACTALDTDVWLATLAEALASPVPRTTENVVAHLLHPVLDVMPDALTPLLTLLGAGTSTSHVRALLAVLRAAKMRDLCTLVDDDAYSPAVVPVRVPCSVVRTCIACSEPRIQIAALALVVDAKTPAALFCDAELQVLGHFFEESLVLPSAVARQDSIALFVKLLVRIRVGMHMVSKHDGGEHASMQHLFTTLFHSVVQATHPHAPYPCAMLGVSLLALLMEALLPLGAVGNAYARSSLQDAVRALEKAKKTFPSGAAVSSIVPSHALVRRLLDLATKSTYDNIQDTAALLLLRLRPLPATGLQSAAFVEKHILQPSVASMPAAKDAEAHASVQLLRLYHALGTNAPIQDAALRTLRAAIVSLKVDAAPFSCNWTRALVQAHAALLQGRLQFARRNGLDRASACESLHGTLAALHTLVSLCSPEEAAPFCEEVQDLVGQVWALTKPILSAAAPEGAQGDLLACDSGLEPAPELSQAMQYAPTNTLPESSTPAYQRILSYAWRAMKESSALYAATLAKSAEGAYATPAALHHANEMFLEWLLHIRHRGAFSTIYPRYEETASALLHTKEYATFPAAWLAQLLTRLDAHVDAFSTTRRSAGIGFAVLALLCTDRTSLEPTMHTLLHMTTSAEPVRKVHGLNIVRVLIMDSTLAKSMRPHLGSALARAVHCFSSQDWRVRNASMMLFAAISTRYFGIKAYGDAGNAHYLNPLLSDDLRDAMSSVLSSASCHVAANDLAQVGHGSALYAVLLLLSKLEPRVSHPFPVADTLLALERCAHSANWKLREQAAASFAMVLDPAQRDATVARLLAQCSTGNQNALHGTLLLLKAIKAHGIEAHVDRLLAPNACPATLAAFLALAPLSSVVPWLRALFDALLANGNATAALKSLLQDPFVVWLYPIALHKAMDAGVALPLHALLHVHDDLCAALLHVLHERETRPWSVAEMYTAALGFAVAPRSLDVRIRAAQFAHALDYHGTMQKEQAQRLLVEILATESSALYEALLPLLGHAARDAAPDVFRTCAWIWARAAEDGCSLQSRLGTASSLDCVRTRIFASDGDAHATFTARRVLLKLLNDDDADVRAMACATISAQVGVPRSVYPAVEALRLGNVACTEFMWDALDSVAHSAWSTLVWEILTSEMHPEQTQRATNTLFPSEEENQFYDRVPDILRAYRWLASRRIAPPQHVDLRALANSLLVEIEARAERLCDLAFIPSLEQVLVVQLATVLGVLPAQPIIRTALHNLLVHVSQEQRTALRIALISDFFFPNVGGVEGHMYTVAQHLLQRGHKVIVITHAYAPHRRGVRYLSGGLKVYYIPLPIIERQDVFPSLFNHMPIMRAILLREDIQLVHGHQTVSSLALESVFHAKAMGLKTVFTDHSLYGFAEVSSILTNKLLRFVFTDIDHVVCVSHTGRENTVLRSSLPPEKVSTIPNAIDARRFVPDPSLASNDRICIVVLSRLVYRKGIDLLLFAIPRLCAMHPDVDFLIGGDGPKYVELEQMREKYMLQDRVVLVGAVPQREVQRHLCRGHIFLNTSLTEAFGTSIIEATCVGLYVVTTRVGGIPELLPPAMLRLADPTVDAIVRETVHAIAHVRNKRHDPAAQHQAVSRMYSWSETVRRLEIAYGIAMAAPPRTATERFQAHVQVGGPIAGKILVLVIAAQMVLLAILEWCKPAARIHKVSSVHGKGLEAR